MLSKMVGEIDMEDSFDDAAGVAVGTATCTGPDACVDAGVAVIVTVAVAGTALQEQPCARPELNKINSITKQYPIIRIRLFFTVMFPSFT
jgi:hypothetical protein